MVLANHQHVVVGVDGSAGAEAAALWAADIAQSSGSPLHLVCAVEESYFYMAEPAMVVSVDILDHYRAQAHDMVEKLAARITDKFPEAQISKSVDTGSVADVLVGYTHTSRMAVIGASGSGIIGSVLLGSIAQRVLENATCPVVVWREGASAGDGPIVVGIDGSPASSVAVAEAFDMASTLGKALIAVHTWNTRTQSGGVTIPLLIDWSAVKTGEAVLLSESLAGWSEKYPNVPVSHVVREGNSAHALVEQSATAQLIVVGSRGRGAVSSALLGSTSSNLAHHAHCPVMICRPSRSSSK
ncbi:universal stress protein [Rhodococcus sp. G-MC3]|uniref:universal stress protein n=1 Tax=Rhodococcus sp. G-MC3 TaxID=3046209 RepID=UPI0024B918CF|nr:universal stress protein [Rhodococcus sp. G-MC3]MDJ0396481.1 universal stress protein [Rhodococcus sp. G-MC3]